MKRFLVGGAVRDQLLGCPVGDRDWLVTGVSPQQLLELGYQQVGRDFPVFLHPQTKEECALPRCPTDGLTERQQVEADLSLRDLTINAMAIGPDDELIDPLNGQADLNQRLLRHTPAFADDPIRVLRLARLGARYATLGFHPADETVALVKTLADAGKLETLVAERVWSEIDRALQESRPAVFFQTLRQCGALSSILPELDRLFGVPQPEKHHPEIDTGIHSLMVLEQACRLSHEPEVRFAALVHDLGKGVTPAAEWPHHRGHEERGVRLVLALCKRLRVPNKFSSLARQVTQYHTHCHKAAELKPGTVLKVLMALDCQRKPQRLEQFLTACKADTRGRAGYGEKSYPQAEIFREALQAVTAVDCGALARQTDDPSKLPALIAQQRTKAIAQRLSSL
ncbi:MAG: multifunctional CCA addition/repair protein [Candidatus Sedimenticola sp. (ex Thyasira tokunagai)]